MRAPICVRASLGHESKSGARTVGFGFGSGSSRLRHRIYLGIYLLSLFSYTARTALNKLLTSPLVVKAVSCRSLTARENLIASLPCCRQLK